MNAGRLPVLGELLANDCHLYVWCNVCERMPAILTARQACDLMGERTPIYGCWGKLKCRCGAKGSMPGAMTAMSEQISGFGAIAGDDRERMELTKARARVIGWLAWRGWGALKEMDPLWPKNLRRQTPKSFSSRASRSAT